MEIKLPESLQVVSREIIGRDTTSEDALLFKHLLNSIETKTPCKTNIFSDEMENILSEFAEKKLVTMKNDYITISPKLHGYMLSVHQNELLK